MLNNKHLIPPSQLQQKKLHLPTPQQGVAPVPSAQWPVLSYPQQWALTDKMREAATRALKRSFMFAINIS